MTQSPLSRTEDEIKQAKFDAYIPGLGYGWEIAIYAYYDGPLMSSTLTEQGDIYIMMASEIHDTLGIQEIFTQVTAEDLEAYHQKAICFVTLFDRGVAAQGQYLSVHYGRADCGTEELTEWKTDYHEKRLHVFNHEYIAEHKNAYLMTDYHSMDVTDFAERQKNIREELARKTITPT